MITRDNLKDVVNNMSRADKKRLKVAVKNSTYEYAVLELSIFNVGSVTRLKLTNDYDRFKNVSNYGNCILLAEEIEQFLE